MNAFCASVLAFFVIFFTNAGGYTFRESNDIYFALSNTEMSVEKLKQRENRLYFESSEKLTVFCQLVDKNNWSLARSEELSKKYILSGLLPYITFRNKTWWNTYKFEAKDKLSSFRWRLEIQSDVFIPGVDDILFEPWFVTVELGYGLGLYETKGILIPKYQLINFTQNFGSMVDQSFVMRNSSSSRQFIVRSAPCCGDILFVLPFRNQSVSSVGGCYFGITYGAFMPETTLWLDVCRNQSVNNSLCTVFSSKDCSSLRLLDMAVTRNFLIFATSFGLVKSSSFSVLMSKEKAVKNTFLEISSPSTLTSSFASGDINMQYTPYCLDFHVYNENNDFIYILSTGATRKIYRSQSPYTLLSQLPFSSQSFKSAEFLGIVNDVTKSSEILLMKTTNQVLSLERYMVLVVSQDPGRHVVFPPWYFSESSIATGIQFHSWSNTLFVYGSEVWKSRDGGNSFKQLTELRSLERITALSFPQYGDSIVALTNHEKILNGRTGTSRLIAIHYQTLARFLDFILVDELETMKGFSQNGSRSLFGDYYIEKINFESYQKNFCTDHLLLQFIGRQDVYLFVAAPFEQLPINASFCFGAPVVRQVLKSRLGGSAHISELTHLKAATGYYTRARGKVMEDFVGLTPLSAPVLKLDLDITLLSSAFYEVVCKLTIASPGWSTHDVGRTVVLANGMSVLLMKYINASIMYGLPPPGFSPSLLPRGNQMSGKWQLFDLTSATLVLEKIGSSLTISFSQGKFKATPNVAFTNVFVGKVLMIHSHNYGLIEALHDVWTASFQNNSLLKEGTYSHWRLLEPRVYSSEPKEGFGMWWLEEEDCSNFPIVTPRKFNTLRHLDTQDNVSLQFAVLAQHLESAEPQISMHVSNPSLFFIGGTHQHFETNHTLHVILRRKPRTTGLSQMSFSIPYLSLKCPSVSNVLTVHGGCPPTKRLVFEYPTTFLPNVFLYGTPRDSDGVVRHYKLPANYRPPSSRGIGIPMSSNLYNVHPEKPPYKERFKISQTTRVYKQCSGKYHRRDCECDHENITMSRLVAYSDCINTVYRLMHGEVFRPNFTVIQEDTTTRRFVDPYYIVELNQRSDYTLIRSITLTVPGYPSPIVALQDRFNSSLEFSGSGLYHFRAKAVKEGYTLCDLTDEFIVFIDDLPLPHPAEDVVRFTTAMLFVTSSFLAYLWFLYYHKERDMNRVFADT